MRPYEGLLTAMVTPFAADGSVDEANAVAMARHLLDNGSDGLVVAGTTGESATLTDDEQVGLVRTLAEEFGREAVICAGAGSNDTRHAAHLTEAVIEAGAHSVLSVTPYYNKPNRRGIRRHYEEVAKAAAGTPVILYNIPGRCALNLPPDQLAELAQIDGIAAVKQANAEEIQPIDGLEILAGNDDNLVDVLEIGGAGGICVSSHIVGNEMKRLLTEADRRRELDEPLKDVYAAMFITSSPAPVKAALRMMGIDPGAMRLPMVECDEAELAEIRGVLERHGLLETSAA